MSSSFTFLAAQVEAVMIYMHIFTRTATWLILSFVCLAHNCTVTLNETLIGSKLVSKNF